jgi:sugar-specific transcriptional regulator TrmB
LQPLSYHEYRKRVRLENEKRKSESQLVINKRKRTTTETELTYSEKVSKRWQTSKSLQKIKELGTRTSEEKAIKDIVPTKADLIQICSFDQDLYHFLRQFASGITRSFLVNHFNIPRTTIYDSLMRLEVKHLVSRKQLSTVGRGRKPIHFFARSLPDG